MFADCFDPDEVAELREALDARPELWAAFEEDAGWPLGAALLAALRSKVGRG